MHKKYKILAIFGIILTLLFPQVILIAQEDGAEGELSSDTQGLDTTQALDPSGVKSGELTNCFDTYKFGVEGLSLYADTESNDYKASDLMEVLGSIVNKNPYPIIDLTVRARVLRSHPNPVIQKALYTTVDDFVVLDNINLKANQEYLFNYSYYISQNAPSGDYIIQYYVYNQNRFNLSGLSFTEDIISSTTEFTVAGGSEHIYLDKTNITVDGQINDTRAFITSHEKGKNIPIKLPLVNPTSTAREMRISYKLYKWDEILEDNFIEEQAQELTIEANSKIDLEYIANTNTGDYPVYYVVIEALPVDQRDIDLNKEKTMAHIRFSVQDNNRPRVNWVGLNKNPFEGGDIELLTCVHNTVFQTDEGPVKVQSIARDEKGKELSKIEYEGIMPSAISGIKNKLNTDKRFNTVTIETNLYNASNELVDNIITKYDCNEISPELCLAESKSNNIFNRNNIIIISVLVLLGLLGGLIYYKRAQRLKN